MTSLKKLFQQSENISDYIYQIIQFWAPFTQQIIGIPFQKSIDQVSINLAKSITNSHEFLKETSLYLTETLVWLDKTRRRKLIIDRDYQHLYKKLNSLNSSLQPKFLNINK